MDIDDFFIQPCSAKKYKPVPDEILKNVESEIGFNLPELYCKLMKRQNGGYLRRRSYYDGDDLFELFINGSTFHPVEGIKNFRQYVSSYMGEEEIEAAKQQFDYCYPDRLISFSFMYGHSVACFDYGWLCERVKKEPEVVVMAEEYDAPFGMSENFWLENFQELVKGLVYAGYEQDDYHIGISTSVTFEQIMEIGKTIWGDNCEKHDDDRFGWFNFKNWYSWYTGDAYIAMSPNQHLSGNYLFPGHPGCSVIVEVEPRGCLQDEDITNLILDWCELITDKIDGEATLLLAPFREHFF